MARPRKNTIDEATTLRLLRAAEESFGARGYRAARLEDIASTAGIRRSSLLYHFGSKQALYREVVERAFAELHQHMTDAAERAGDDVDGMLEEVTGALLTFASVRPGVPALALRELIDPSAEPGDDGEGVARRAFIALIDALEVLLSARAGARLSESFPTRDAIVAVVMSRLVRAAMGPRAVGIWHDDNEGATTTLIQTLFRPVD